MFVNAKPLLLLLVLAFVISSSRGRRLPIEDASISDNGLEGYIRRPKGHPKTVPAQGHNLKKRSPHGLYSNVEPTPLNSNEPFGFESPDEIFESDESMHGRYIGHPHMQYFYYMFPMTGGHTAPFGQHPTNKFNSNARPCQGHDCGYGPNPQGHGFGHGHGFEHGHGHGHGHGFQPHPTYLPPSSEEGHDPDCKYPHGHNFGHGHGHGHPPYGHGHGHGYGYGHGHGHGYGHGHNEGHKFDPDCDNNSGDSGESTESTKQPSFTSQTTKPVTQTPAPTEEITTLPSYDIDVRLGQSKKR